MFTEDQRHRLQMLSVLEQNEAHVFNSWDKLTYEKLKKDLLKIYDSLKDSPYMIEIFALAERNICEYFENRFVEEDELDLDDYELHDDGEFYDDDEL